MSAFALRKRLLAAQVDSTPAVTTAHIAEQPTNATPTPKRQEQDVASPRRSKRTRLARETSKPKDVPELVTRAPTTQETPVIEKKTPVETASSLPAESLPDLRQDEVAIEASPILFSNFKPSRSNHLRRKNGIIRLKLVDGERLVILGSYGIQVSSGEVTVSGATLGKSKNKVHWVDAPYCHALPVIRCPEEATLEIHPHPEAATLRDLGKLSPYFRRLWNDTSTSKSTFQILYTSEDGPKRALSQDLVSPAEWNKEIARLADKAASRSISVMVTGPKSSGKSTFGKLLANRLLTRSLAVEKNKRTPDVAILDLDPGQPEYGVPGQISLIRVSEPVLQPSFCHPLPGTGYEVIRSHSLASISPASDPDLYLESARDLVTHYYNTLGSSPLIVNTPGWIQGTGLDLLTSLITDLRPTEVVYMSLTGPTEAVESLEEACKTTTFSTLPSQTTQFTSRIASHLRAMQTMSYFHAESGVNDGLTRWNAVPLTTVPPWIVSYMGEARGIFGIMLYDYQTPPELLAEAINGTIMAIVEVESPLAFRELVNAQQSDRGENDDNDDTENADARMDIDGEQNTATTPSLIELHDRLTVSTPEGLPLISATAGTAHGTGSTTLDPRYSRFVGLALVRGIDVRGGALQLLTPVPAERIEEIGARGSEIVLVGGRFDGAGWAYTEDLHFRASKSRQEGGDEGANDEENDHEVLDDVEDETDADASDDFEEDDDADGYAAPTPWIEVLHGNQKRGVGSKVWRVRRDLGRGGNAAD